MVVSVIIPFFNEIEQLNFAIKSVFEQEGVSDELEFQILVGNDGPFSDQEVLLSVDRCFRSSVAVYRNMFKSGPGGARNTALSRATGDVIAFLDSDDVWERRKIQKQLSCFKMGATFIATAYSIDDHNIIVRPPSRISCPYDIFFKLGVGTSTVMICRKLIGDSRFKDFRFSQDIDFWFRLASLPGFSYQAIQDSLVVYSSGGSSKNKFVQAASFWQVMEANNIPAFRRLVALLRYATRGVWYHYVRKRLS